MQRHQFYPRFAKVAKAKGTEVFASVPFLSILPSELNLSRAFANRLDGRIRVQTRLRLRINDARAGTASHNRIDKSANRRAQ